MTLPVLRRPSPLRQWDPLRELDDLHERMSQLMSSVFGTPSREAELAPWTPLADVAETEDFFVVEVDVPGVRRDDIEVRTSDNELIVTGEFKERERAGWLRTHTRRVGRFEYRTILPQNIDTDRIGAELADGVLTVRVPKSDVAQPRRIPIEAH